MPGPYDYTLNIPDPSVRFLQGLQVAKAMEQEKAAQEQARRRNEVMRNLMALGGQAKAQDYINAAMQFPEDRELFQQSWEMIDEGNRDALFKAGSEAYTLLAPDAEGKVNAQAAIDRLEEYATGFENAGNDDMARQLRDAISVVKINPAAGRSTIGTVLAFADSERFKGLGERTAAIQNFEYFKQAVGEDFAQEVVAGDDNITTVLPNGGFYAGPASGLAQVLGQGGAAPASIPTVQTPEEAKKLPPGSQFRMPDGRIGTVPGGTAGNGGGNFRAGR